MIKKVVIIDYGAGNLKSITKALKVLGLNPIVLNPLLPETNSQILSCDLIVLPGVGEFGSSLRVLDKIKDIIIKHVVSNKPLLGICLGIQLLFNKSEESPGKIGLGIVPGKVVKFKFKNLNNRLNCQHINSLPIPHMCWNKVKFVDIKSEKDKRKIILQKLKKEEFFYFIHSYYPIPKDERICFGTTEYGKEFCSMIVKNNIVATQFHLEKSGDKGLLLLKNVIKYLEKI